MGDILFIAFILFVIFGLPVIGRKVADKLGADAECYCDNEKCDLNHQD